MRLFFCCVLAGASLLATSCSNPESDVRNALLRGNGVVRLPPGVLEIRQPLVLPEHTSNLEIIGTKDSVLRAAKDFGGKALIQMRVAERVTIRDFAIDGNRSEIGRPIEMPSPGIPFAAHFQNNGILVEEGETITIRNVKFEAIDGFAVLVNHSKQVNVSNIQVNDSGSRNGRGRNNSSGGVLFEGGTEDFEVSNSTFRNVLGTAVWTHSNSLDIRNFTGRILGNTFEWIGRDAIHISHMNRVRVEKNSGKQIGYPVNVVDVEGKATPVAIDTSGDVDEAIYANNRFEEINGKCIDLDGFHDGEVTGNVCINKGKPDEYPQGHFALVMNNTNPNMRSQNILIRNNVFDGTQFGGIFIIGTGHTVTGNKLTRINLAHCDGGTDAFGCDYLAKSQPLLLRTGIYLALQAERTDPATGNRIEGNEISGFEMATQCINFAKEVVASNNVVRNNRCSNSQ
jgi:hypothetical protein